MCHLATDSNACWLLVLRCPGLTSLQLLIMSEFMYEHQEVMGLIARQSATAWACDGT